MPHFRGSRASLDHTDPNHEHHCWARERCQAAALRSNDCALIQKHSQGVLKRKNTRNSSVFCGCLLCGTWDTPECSLCSFLSESERREEKSCSITAGWRHYSPVTDCSDTKDCICFCLCSIFSISFSIFSESTGSLGEFVPSLNPVTASLAPKEEEEVGDGILNVIPSRIATPHFCPQRLTLVLEIRFFVKAALY